MAKNITVRIPDTPEAKLVARVLRLKQLLKDAEVQLECLRDSYDK
jgi:hypothetical protein